MYEELTAEDYPSMAKHINLPIQEAEKTQTEWESKETHAKTLTQTTENQGQGKNFESR